MCEMHFSGFQSNPYQAAMQRAAAAPRAANPSNPAQAAQTQQQLEQQRQQALEQIKTERYNEIYAHEMAHASAAGAYGGGIQMQFGPDGMPIGGSVPVFFPALSKDNPEEALHGAQTIYNAALAPSDPSGADHGVAARAQSMIGAAQVLIQQKQQQEMMKASQPAHPMMMPAYNPYKVAPTGQA
jgi:cell wall-associated NlpC family hydrolase